MDARSSTFGKQYVTQLGTELKRLLRNGRIVFFTLAFPALFYLLMMQVFGAQGGTLNGLNTAQYLLASMCAFGVMGAGLNLFGTRLAIERSQGWTQLLRTTPLRASSTLLARWSSGLIFSAAIVVVMMAIGSLEGSGLHGGALLEAAVILWLGALPFGALGLALGYLIDAKSGQVISMMVYFFLSIFGGLWWPLEIMPKVMQTIANYLPSYHYAYIVRLLMTGRTSTTSIAILAGFTVAFLLLAWWGWRRDEGKVYA